MDAKRTSKLTALCCLAYFSSYITRLDYAAVLVEIVQDLQIAKTTAGIAVTGSFITYGVGMLLFGVAADYIKPRTLITVGLLGTSVINLAMGVLLDMNIMIAIWCFNGFFQAMVWPPVTRILAEQLGETASRGAIAKVILAAQVATLAIYVLSPAAIRLSGWRLVFLAAGAVGLASVLLWRGGTAGLTQKAADRAQREAVPERAPVGRLIVQAGLIPLMIAILLMGMLRDGLQTWMPTYICEVFGLSSETSILISGLLPVVSMVAITLSTMLLQRSNNEPLSGALFFAVGFAAAAVMVLIFLGSAAVGVSLFVVLAGSMHGVNQLIICYTPAHFEPYGRVATFSGLLNCFVYVGAATSTYGFAGFSEAFGWRSTMILWMCIALLGVVFCLLCVRKWQRFCRKEQEI